MTVPLMILAVGAVLVGFINTTILAWPSITSWSRSSTRMSHWLNYWHDVRDR